MAGTLIPNSLTAWTITGENYWQGKSHKNAWWNSYQSRWDGVLPYDENGALSTAGDYYIAGDITGTINWEMGVGTAKIELEDRSSGRLTIYWDDAGKRLYAISFHDGSSEYWEVTYNSTTDEYSFDVGSAGSGEAVPGIDRDAGGALNTGSLYVVPNGDVWVGLLTSARGLELNRRSGGSWNGSTVVLDATLDNGICSISHFENAGTTNVYVFSAEDDLVASAEFNAYFIAEDHASAMTAGNWTEDTVSAATLIGDVADNHIDTVRDSSDNIYIVGKSGTSTTGETLIYLLDRTPGGTYTAHEVTQKQASAADDRSRPCVAWDFTNGKLVIGYSKQQTGDLVSWKTSAAITDLDTWSAETEIFADSGNSISNLRTPQQNFAATDTTGILFLAELVVPAGAASGDSVMHHLHDVTFTLSDSLTVEFKPKLGQFITLAVNQAGLNVDSPILAHGLTGIIAGDQLETELLGSLGNTATLTADGEITGLDLLETIDFAVIDSADSYSRSIEYTYIDKKGQYLAIDAVPTIALFGTTPTINVPSLTSAITVEYLPTLDQFVTLTVNFAGLHPSSPLNEPAFSHVVIGDQLAVPNLSVEANPLTLFSNGLVQGTQGDTFSFALWDASGPYTRTVHAGEIDAVTLAIPPGLHSLDRQFGTITAHRLGGVLS